MTDSLPRDAVDQAVADHYATQSLDADALQALRDEIDAIPSDAGAPAPAAVPAPARVADDRPAARPAHRFRTRLMAGLVALSVVAVALLAWPEPALTGEAVAQEIATSHVMRLSPDVEATSFEEARAELDKLDFAAVRPDPGVMTDFELTGARYTRLGGEMGAEFQITDAAGRPCTLFQVRDDRAFRNVSDATYEIDGVRVKVWREAGLLMGLAESSNPTPIG